MGVCVVEVSYGKRVDEVSYGKGVEEDLVKIYVLLKYTRKLRLIFDILQGHNIRSITYLVIESCRYQSYCTVQSVLTCSITKLVDIDDAQYSYKSILVK